MEISRRQAIVGVTLAAGTVAGCATYGKPPAAPAPSSGPAPVQAVAKTTDIPLGSGAIVGDMVITQPAPGKFNAFSSVCTHAGCTVSEVVGASINCPCHGSRFNLDGTVAQGPAKRPLDAKPITVQGDSLTISA